MSRVEYDRDEKVVGMMLILLAWGAARHWAVGLMMILAAATTAAIVMLASSEE